LLNRISLRVRFIFILTCFRLPTQPRSVLCFAVRKGFFSCVQFLLHPHPEPSQSITGGTVMALWLAVHRDAWAPTLGGPRATGTHVLWRPCTTIFFIDISLVLIRECFTTYLDQQRGTLTCVNDRARLRRNWAWLCSAGVYELQAAGHIRSAKTFFVNNEKNNIFTKMCWFGRMQHIRKQSHYVGCPDLELLCNSLCSSRTETVVDPCLQSCSA